MQPAPLLEQNPTRTSAHMPVKPGRNALTSGYAGSRQALGAAYGVPSPKEVVARAGRRLPALR
jgi:hypothetical protein